MSKTALQGNGIDKSQTLAYNQAGVIAINTTLLQVDCTAVRNIDIQAISIGTTGVVTPQISMDGGTTWNAVTVQNTNSGAATTTLTSGANHRLSIGGGLFRLQLTTATTGGTTNIRVTISATPLATAIGPLPINLTQISGAANNSGGFTGGLGVGGPSGHSSAATGNPVMVGGVVSTSLDTTLASGDMCRLQESTSGQLVTLEGAVPELSWQYAAATGGITNTTDVAAKAAAGASIRNYVRSMQVKNANATATEFVIKDGSTVIWRGHLAASMGTSDVHVFNPPLRGTANTAINIACITTGAQVYASLQGYTGI